MSIRAALRSRVLESTDITNVISERFYYREAPSVKTKPYAVYTIRTDWEHTLDGALDIPIAEIYIDIVSDTAAQAADLADLIRGQVENQDHVTW